MLYDFPENDIALSAHLFNGEFVKDPVALWRLSRLAMLGQCILATPDGIAQAWKCERRVIAKSIDAFAGSSLISVAGTGWVREITINRSFIVSRRANGTTPDLDCTVAHGWKLPEGPVSAWRGRTLPAATRARILARDGSECRYCGSTAGPFHIDHIEPVAKGGSDADGNLCVACRPCNLSKSDKALAEWRAKRP